MANCAILKTLKDTSSGHAWHGLVWLTLNDMPSKIFCLYGTSHLKGQASLARCHYKSLTYKYGETQRVMHSPWWLCQPPFSSWPPNQHPRNIRLNNYTRWRLFHIKISSFLQNHWCKNMLKMHSRKSKTEPRIQFVSSPKCIQPGIALDSQIIEIEIFCEKRRSLGKPKQIRSGPSKTSPSLSFINACLVSLLM